LDQELAALRGREGVLAWLQAELEEKITDSLRKFSELGEKDSDLQSTRRELGEARQ